MTEAGDMATPGHVLEPTSFDVPSNTAARCSARSLARGLITQAVRNRWLVFFNVVALMGGTALIVRSLAMRQPKPLMPMPYAFIPSPNCDERPQGAVVSCIVVHATVEPTTEGTLDIFLTPEKRVSAHFVVGRDGRVVQMVPVEKRAWHAGTSVLEGVGKVNDYSVGIEMVNLNDGKDPYPPEQMEAVAGIIRLIRFQYDVPDARIVSHAQVALPAGRKSDPAGFDFDKLRTMARSAGPVPPSLNPPPLDAQSKESRDKLR